MKLLNVFCIDETEIYFCFPDTQFGAGNIMIEIGNIVINIGNIVIKILYVSEGFLVKKFLGLEGKMLQIISIGIPVTQKKCCIIFVDKTPHSSYENILTMYDLNMELYIKLACDVTLLLSNILSKENLIEDSYR